MGMNKIISITSIIVLTAAGQVSAALPEKEAEFVECLEGLDDLNQESSTFFSDNFDAIRMGKAAGVRDPNYLVTSEINDNSHFVSGTISSFVTILRLAWITDNNELAKAITKEWVDYNRERIKIIRSVYDYYETTDLRSGAQSNVDKMKDFLSELDSIISDCGGKTIETVPLPNVS